MWQREETKCTYSFNLFLIGQYTMSAVKIIPDFNLTSLGSSLFSGHLKYISVVGKD